MRLKLLPVILLLVLVPAAVSQGSPKITPRNWRQHPEIKKIRDVYKEVRKKIDAGKFTRSIRLFHFCEPEPGAGGVQRTLYTQGGKLVRQYTTNRNFEGGVSEDVEYYYDARGRLRFVFAIYTDNQAEGQVQYRIYYDARGLLIWENRRHVKGPKNIGAPAKGSEYFQLELPLDDFKQFQPSCN